MPQEEKYGSRDRTYSAWHRMKSTQRFVGCEKAKLLSMIDLDASLYVEWEDRTKDPLAFIETAKDVGQPIKPATVTRKISELCCAARRVPAYVLLYTLAAHRNEADSEWFDIRSFRVRRLWPDPEDGWTVYTPEEWAVCLVSLRTWAAQDLDECVPVDVAKAAFANMTERQMAEFYDWVQGQVSARRTVGMLPYNNSTTKEN